MVRYTRRYTRPVEGNKTGAPASGNILRKVRMTGKCQRFVNHVAAPFCRVNRDDVSDRPNTRLCGWFCWYDFAHGNAAPRQPRAVSRKFPGAKLLRYDAASYDFHFGKDNFSLPGNAATVGNEFISADAFPEPEYCQHCHEEAYHQWRQSLHSNSFRTPFYRTSVNILRVPRASSSPGIAIAATTRRRDVRRIDKGFPSGSQLRSGWSDLHHMPLHSTIAVDFRQRQLCHGCSRGNGG